MVTEFRENLDPDALEVRVAELLVATADDSDGLIDRAVPEVLGLLRERMHMDVVFVSEFTKGERVFRYVDQAPGTQVIAPGDADPLEETWCQRVVDGRLPEFMADTTSYRATHDVPGAPFPVGTHLSTPIVLGDGQVYGTLCCFSFGVNGCVNEQDLQKLRYTAQLTAKKIDKSRDSHARMALEPTQEESLRGSL